MGKAGGFKYSYHKIYPEYLKIDTPLYYESRIGTSLEATDRILELCEKLKADTYLSGSGGKDYLEEEKFSRAGIKLEYQHFVHPQYRQQFVKQEGDFLPYMSIVDLLFNEGPRVRIFYVVIARSVSDEAIFV